MTDAAFAAICAHEHIVDPPSGKRLRICLDCLSRIIECDHCDAKLVAGPDVSDSGWTSGGMRCGEVVTRWWTCPGCQRYR